MSALDDLAAILEAIDAERRTLLVPPELEDGATKLVEASWLSGLVEVKSSPNLPKGKAYLIDERAVRAILDQPVRVEFEPHTLHTRFIKAGAHYGWNPRRSADSSRQQEARHGLR